MHLDFLFFKNLSVTDFTPILSNQCFTICPYLSSKLLKILKAHVFILCSFMWLTVNSDIINQWQRKYLLNQGFFSKLQHYYYIYTYDWFLEFDFWSSFSNKENYVNLIVKLSLPRKIEVIIILFFYFKKFFLI